MSDGFSYLDSTILNDDEDIIVGVEDDDPIGILNKTCGLNGCVNKCKYEEIGNRRYAYKIGNIPFCCAEHALYYYNLKQLMIHIKGYTMPDPKKGQVAVGELEEEPDFDLGSKEFKALFEEDIFEFRSVPIRLEHEDLKETPYFAQLMRIPHEQFIEELTKDTWHLAPNLFNMDSWKQKVYKTLNLYSDYRGSLESFKLDARAECLAPIFLEYLSYLFTSNTYRPVPKTKEGQVRKVSLKRHHVEVQNGFLNYYRYGEEKNAQRVFNRPLFMWPNVNNEFGTMKGIVIGEGRTVYEFLIYVGFAQTRRIDEMTMQIQVPKNEYWIQVFLKPVTIRGRVKGE